jgi:hypothetical protein
MDFIDARALAIATCRGAALKFIHAPWRWQLGGMREGRTTLSGTT